VAVSALFLLSGFVLAVNYPAPLDRAGRFRFIVARFARIYPSYLAAFAIYVPIAIDEWFGRTAPLPVDPALGFAASALLSLGLVQAWLPWTARAWNAPGWATSAIAFGYLVFPWAAARLSRLHARALLAATAAAWLCGLVPALAYAAFAPDGWSASPGTQGALVDLVKHHPIARIGEMLTGVALGLWWTKAGHRVNIPTWAAPCAALATFALATFSPPLLPYALVHDGLLSPLLAVVLVGLASGRGLFARALSARPLVAVGEAGFAIYVLQWPVWFVAERVARTAGVDTLTGTWFCTMLAAHVAFCLAWVRWAERPLRRAIRTGFDEVAARFRPALAAQEP
jgi:peptidoglycan/LPS O-acetylase OafA/YrhL